jgi:hypothetical protein
MQDVAAAVAAVLAALPKAISQIADDEHDGDRGIETGPLQRLPRV